MTSGYAHQYGTVDLNRMTVDFFGTGINATIQWMDLMVLLFVVGMAVALVLGIFFKLSRIMGMS